MSVLDSAQQTLRGHATSLGGVCSSMKLVRSSIAGTLPQRDQRILYAPSLSVRAIRPRCALERQSGEVCGVCGVDREAQCAETPELLCGEGHEVHALCQHKRQIRAEASDGCKRRRFPAQTEALLA
eukprot:3017130-Rhodomonas_salina.2